MIKNFTSLGEYEFHVLSYLIKEFLDNNDPLSYVKINIDKIIKYMELPNNLTSKVIVTKALNFLQNYKFNLSINETEYRNFCILEFRSNKKTNELVGVYMHPEAVNAIGLDRWKK